MADLDLGPIKAREAAATRTLIGALLPGTADAEFIAHARTDVRLLIAEVEHLREVEGAALSVIATLWPNGNDPAGPSWANRETSLILRAIRLASAQAGD